MLLELINVQKKFASPSGDGEVVVLRDISLEVAGGEAIAVVGPSGSGKSTLLNIIGALEKPTSGSVRLEGQNLADLGDDKLSIIRNQKIGFVFQLHHLLPQCTVLENVLIPTIPLKTKADSEENVRRARVLLGRIGLENFLDHFPAQLSGGEMQRVAVVRALINQPKLVLADEPTGSLDKQSSDKLGEILIELNKEQGTTLIVVTHSQDLAQPLDKIYQIQNGKLEKIK